MRYTNLNFIILILLNITVSVYAEGLSTLIEVGKSQNAMQKTLDKETKSFEALKKAIQKGAIKKGESQDVIKKRYGEPVIILPDKQYAKKWVYKPGYATWFDGVRIYLFFDDDKKLKKIKSQSRNVKKNN